MSWFPVLLFGLLLLGGWIAVARQGAAARQRQQDQQQRSAAQLGELRQQLALVLEQGRALGRAQVVDSGPPPEPSRDWARRGLASLFATATSIGRSADGVAQAQEFTIAALTQAQDGVAAVQSVRQSIDVAAQSVQLATETMRELERRSLEIENVVSLIKDVADQTKLIALNAAIEAARAGSHGRGFSVVADAVRRLAEQTGQATAQVAQLIGGIQRDTAQAVQHLARAQVEVAGGVAKTGQAGAELQRIADTADQMVQTIDTIAEATHAALTSHAEATGLLDQVAADPPPTAKG